MILFVIIVLLFHFYSCGMEQDFIPIKTSTGLEILPKWQIRESNTLYKYFLQEKDNKENPLKTITLLSISSDEISLFSQALNNAHNFNNFFKNLTPTKQKQLITAAGKYSAKGKNLKLNAKGLTTYLLHTYFNQDFLEENIYPHIPMDNLVTNLKHTRIISNIQNYAITHTIIPCNTYKRTSPANGDYVLAPLISDNKNQQEIFLSFYTGDYINKNLEKKEHHYNDIKEYYVEYHKKIDHSKIHYFITNDIPQKSPSYKKTSFDSYKKYLWLKSNNQLQIYTIIKTIEHPKYKIQECIFSDDGHYLATLSFNPNWEDNILLPNNAHIILTTLGIKEDGSDVSDIIITGPSITSLCFNPQSTILSIGTTNGIDLWETDGTFITHLCDNDFPFIKDIIFNHSGNGLFALSAPSPSTTTFLCKNKLILWDINTSLSKEIILDDDAVMGNITLYPYYNIFSIVATLSKSLIQALNKNLIPCFLYFIDSETGNVMYKKELQEIKENLPPIITLSPNGLLCAKTSSSTNQCDIELYDFYKQTSPIKLLSNQSDIIGIGFTYNEQSLITAFKNKKYMNTMLYDDSTLYILEWIRHKTNILQRYFLYRLYKAITNNQTISFHAKSIAHTIVESLPTEPYKIKQCIKHIYKI